MAERRMMSKKIIDSDLFMDMPPSTQVLYFHLLLRADDEGFVGSVRNIMKLTGSNGDDYKILLAKRFIIEFPSGICVIKHWYIHNYIQNDRYTDSRYVDEKKLIGLREDKVYCDISEACTQNVSKLDTQYRKGKDRLVENRKEEKEAELPDWLDLSSWNSWIQYKKETKKPLSRETIKLQLKFLEENKSNHKQIIATSIQKGWVGLFEPRKDSFNNQRPSNVLISDHTKTLLEHIKKKTIKLTLDDL